MAEETSGEADRTGEESDVGPRRFLELLTRAEETIEKIESKADEDDLGPVLSELDDLEDVVDEAEDLLETMDLTELVGAVDWEAIPDAVDLSELPGAIREGDPGDAVRFRELLGAVDLSTLLDNVDEREFMREKRQLDDEIEDVTGGGSGSGEDDVDFDVDVGGGGSIDDDLDPRAIQVAVQREISGAIGEFREKLIEAHHRLDALREANEERFDERRTGSKSRNPTAGFSTLPRAHAGTGGAARFSTVPEETKYSTAPNRKRIYGDRFESWGGEDDG